ncbi:hypothetical protein D3C87_1007310 [compost metagenome]|uniref:hypothetical protein n=1 Tax=Sphingobacterium sp. DR205 TaxID=2713573 RepID=UPI000F9277A1|nr:hypothetical protein [Sphingobacterium sp. DR205]QIH35597.1 hypothetical protein G6053_23190 [Sphingobacterium sp. DR205]
MKKIINKIGRVLQVILLAPVKLPGKALDILKYLSIGVGIIESVIDEKKEPEKEETDKEGEGKDENQ